MSQRRTSAVVLLMGWLAGFGLGTAIKASVPQGQPAPQPGTITNGSFEDLSGQAPAGWKAAVFQKGADLTVDSSGHTGAHSARIASAAGGDAAWTTVVPVRPFARYRLSGWIKTEGVEAGTGAGALLHLHNLDDQRTAAVTGTHDWTRVDVEFDTEANDAVQVDCQLGGRGKSRGVAWFDDVALELLSARELRPTVTIQPAKVRPPLSKYIYGQFIEHVGRDIYGGLWAEMLEDRKFFYALGDADSPWKPSGAPKSIVMETSDPFVGVHSPEITVAGNGQPGGIEQGGLAVTAGHRYVGRIRLAGQPLAAPVRVSLIWGPRDKDRQTTTINDLTNDFSETSLSFKPELTTDEARLTITGIGNGMFRVGVVSLMPADNVDGFRADTFQLLKELNAPIYRWPGGNFASGYNWRDGMGERDQRPPRKNPAWTGIEPNDVGLVEYLNLCRLIGADPYITVNSGLGEAASAADEVEYVNGAPTTPMGRLRARDGMTATYACRFWSIGNEMYGDWQLGHVPLEQYEARHNAFARAMRAKDPSITLVGVGEVGPWSEGMLAKCAASMNLISEHFYCQEGLGLMSHVEQIPREIRRIAEAHRRYGQTIPALAGKNIPVALDEWNYWYGPSVYGELGTQYFLKDALGIVAGLHEYSRQSDVIFMANYAQTVNAIGAIKTSKRAAVLDTTGVVLKLYRESFGTIPVEVSGAPEPLDVAAAWRGSGRGLTVSIVNPTRSEQVLEIDIAGAAVPATARLRRVSGSDEKARNEPGQPPQVGVQDLSAAPFGRRLTVPPLSASLYELALTR